MARANDPEPPARPNILWITCEDISPFLGCYGDPHARTPHLDRLAGQGVRFTRAFANAPVCGVARSALLTGVNSAAIGTHHMRSRMNLPPDIPATPKLLQNAGYHTTNNAKKDYNSNFETDNSLWNNSSRQAHWRQRPDATPFFAVFNIEITHESRLDPEHIARLVANGSLKPAPRTDANAISLPPFHPDLPAIRNDWARLHDLISLMDGRVGEILSQLEADGLADDTIVFFFSDHGGMLAGTKRFIHASGSHVPLIIRVPEKWRHLAPGDPGSANDGLVTFTDLPKTVLALAGISPLDVMDGRILFGPGSTPPPQTVHITRDRMSERPDFSRAVTDGRHYLTRHFMPHRPNGRCTRYGPSVQENWRAWENHFEAGLCNPAQSVFYQPKGAIELHDLASDPWQIDNLAADNAARATLERLSADLHRWMLAIRDTGPIPEAMFHQLAGPGTPHETLRHYAQCRQSYPLETILAVASAAPNSSHADITNWLANHHPVVRHWGAYAAFLSDPPHAGHHDALMEMAASDPMAANRIAAATALAAHGQAAADAAFAALMNEIAAPGDGYVFLYAINALQVAGLDARLTRADWQAMRDANHQPKPGHDPYGFQYAGRIISDALDLWPKRRAVR
jgi:arylsulfatase A-like enzyme